MSMGWVRGEASPAGTGCSSSEVFRGDESCRNQKLAAAAMASSRAKLSVFCSDLFTVFFQWRSDSGSWIRGNLSRSYYAGHLWPGARLSLFSPMERSASQSCWPTSSGHTEWSKFPIIAAISACARSTPVYPLALEARSCAGWAQDQLRRTNLARCHENAQSTDRTCLRIQQGDASVAKVQGR